MSLPDAWPSLKRLTPARVALGRTGASLSTGPVLDFQLADAGRLAGLASGGSDVMTEAARCQLSGVVLKEEANGRIPG